MHYGAYTGTGSKKEVSHINFAIKILTGDYGTVLIQKAELGYGLVYRIYYSFSIFDPLYRSPFTKNR